MGQKFEKNQSLRLLCHIGHNTKIVQFVWNALKTCIITSKNMLLYHLQSFMMIGDDAVENHHFFENFTFYIYYKKRT